MSLIGDDLRLPRGEHGTGRDRESPAAPLAAEGERDESMTNDQLCAEMTRLREDAAHGFDDLHRKMDRMAEDLKSTMRLMVDAFTARMDSADRRWTGRLGQHDGRISGLDIRLTGLEHPKTRR